MSSLRPTVLLCDDERECTQVLAADLESLGHTVTIVRSCADAFGTACANDFDALLAAPFLRDGSALVLPGALGIRRPRLVVLTTRLSDRLAPAIAKRVGFDLQLCKVIDAKALDRMIRASIARAEADVIDVDVIEVAVEAEAETPPPASEVGGRVPR